MSNRTGTVNLLGALWALDHSCRPGCKASGRPYCHCQACGETGVILNDGGYCYDCAGKEENR